MITDGGSIKEFLISSTISLEPDLRVPDNALYTDADVDRCVRELEQMEAERQRKILEKFNRVSQHTTNNRKKKQRRK